MRTKRYKSNRPKIMWVLFDIDNGDDGDSKGYTWWFRTRQAAREHKKWQAKQQFCATLVGPFKYVKEGQWQNHTEPSSASA